MGYPFGFGGGGGGGGAVTSVAGRTGDVVLAKADITDFSDSDYMSSTGRLATAGINATQSIGAGAEVVINFVERSDPQSDFNSSTHRYTPSLAGWYAFTLSVKIQNGADQIFAARVYKNGSRITSDTESWSNVADLTVDCAGLVSMNGSTDYLDFRVFNNAASSKTLRTGDDGTFVAIHYIGS